MSEAPQTVAVQGMTIACPEGWRDASMLILSAEKPGSTGVTPNLVITREPASDELPADPVERLEEFVERQLDAMRLSLSGLTEVARRNATATRPSAELKIDWVSDDVPITQWITYANANDTTLTIATATAGQRDFADAEPKFRSMLLGFRLEPGPAAQPQAA